MAFWTAWRQRRLEHKRDRRELQAMLAYAPTAEQEALSAQRRAEADAMASAFEAERRRRARLASSAEWIN